MSAHRGHTLYVYVLPFHTAARTPRTTPQLHIALTTFSYIPFPFTGKPATIGKETKLIALLLPSQAQRKHSAPLFWWSASAAASCSSLLLVGLRLSL